MTQLVPLIWRRHSAHPSHSRIRRTHARTTPPPRHRNQVSPRGDRRSAIARSHPSIARLAKPKRGSRRPPVAPRRHPSSMLMDPPDNCRTSAAPSACCSGRARARPRRRRRGAAICSANAARCATRRHFDQAARMVMPAPRGPRRVRGDDQAGGALRASSASCLRDRRHGCGHSCGARVRPAPALSATPATRRSGAGRRRRPAGALARLRRRWFAGSAAANAPTGASSAANACARRGAAATGRLTINSTPARADVAIDGARRGVTPIDVARPAVRLAYRARHARRLRARDAAREHRGGTAGRVDHPRPGTNGGPHASIFARRRSRGQRRDARARTRLGVRPRRALRRVAADGRARHRRRRVWSGATPLLLTDVSSGSHTIQLQADGHKPWQTTVQVKMGERTRVAASLEEGR